LADPEVGVSLSEIERRRFVAEEKLNEAQLEAVKYMKLAAIAQKEATVYAKQKPKCDA